MWSKLPQEVLELVLTDPAIKKKDLLQLQITCKQWSFISQRCLYEEIRLCDYGAYKVNDLPAIKARFTSLIQSLLANSQLGECIKSFDIGSLFGGLICGDSDEEDLSCDIAMLARLCPNLTTMNEHSSMEYLKTMSQLHCEGYLQRLEFITVPLYIYDATAIATYHATILEFKETIKDITIVDGVSKTVSTECLIPPTSLHLFTNAKHVELQEFARVHLYRVKDYVSNCGPHIRSLSVTMLGANPTPLQGEYNTQSDVQPQENVQELSIYLNGITTDELAFILRMFPSLKKIELNSRETSFDQADMQVVARLLDELSLIPKVDCKFGWQDVATGLGLLPWLAKSLDIKALWVASLDPLGYPTEISIKLQHLKQEWSTTPDGFTARSKTKGLSATVEIFSTEAQTFFARALENLKDEYIESITIGPQEIAYGEPFQTVEQQSIDYIVDHYKGMQDLIFRGVEFPSHAHQSANQTVKHLRYLHLNECKIIGEDYFIKLSCQFKHINHFKISSTLWYSTYDTYKMKIHLPYTTLKTISLDIMFGDKPYYIIRVWTNDTCITLKATWDQTTKRIASEEDHGDNDRFPNHLEGYNYSESLRDDYQKYVVGTLHSKCHDNHANK
ncbi:hypothetical protein MBANPS3_000144 [Mucor bainieri]